MTRTGRRPGGGDTRGAILSAAQAAFASSGYHGATIRGIAADAGVDPALVHHYFGSKEDLFASAIALPLPARQVAEMIVGDGLEGVGERITRFFLSVWESPASREPLLALLRGGLTTEQGATTLREFFETALLERVSVHVEGDDAALRVGLAVAQLIGLAVLRYVVGFETLRRASPDELVEIIAPQIQRYFTG